MCVYVYIYIYIYICLCGVCVHTKLRENDYGELTVRSQTFLQTNELVYHGFMDAGMSHEISESETKAVMTHG